MWIRYNILKMCSADVTIIQSFASILDGAMLRLKLRHSRQACKKEVYFHPVQLHILPERELRTRSIYRDAYTLQKIVASGDRPGNIALEPQTRPIKSHPGSPSSANYHGRSISIRDPADVSLEILDTIENTYLASHDSQRGVGKKAPAYPVLASALLI